MQIKNNKWWVLLATSLSGILVAIDYSIVNVSLANIQRELGSNVNQLQWVMAGFGLTFAALLVVSGRIGDIWGRRKVLYIGVIGFALASLGAGFSQTPMQLIMMRVVQGAFGAAVFPSGMALTAAAFPKSETGRALGIYGSFIGIGLALGPVLGGIITHFLSWRWIFFINIPVIIVSLTLCLMSVSESRIQDKVTIDWWGMFFITIALASLVFGVTESPQYGWQSWMVWSYIIISAISVIILIFIERKNPMPLLPVDLFKNQGFLVGNIIYIVAIGFAWPISFFAPLYLQKVQHFSAYDTGLLLLPMTAMTMLIPPLAGYFLDKKGSKKATYTLFTFLLIGFIFLASYDVNSTLWLILTGFVFFGIAWGMANGIGVPIALSSLTDTDNAGLVSGACSTVLNIFGVVSLAITTSIFRTIISGSTTQTYSHAFIHGYRIAVITLLISSLVGLAVVFFAYGSRGQAAG